MENSLLEKDSNTSPKGDVSINMALETSQCNPCLSQQLKKEKKNKKRNNEKRKHNSPISEDTDDKCPKLSSVEVDPVLHPFVNTCLSTESEKVQHDAQAILTRNTDSEKERNMSHNALRSIDTSQDIQEGGCRSRHSLSNSQFAERADGSSGPGVVEQLESSQKCSDSSSSNEHNGHAEGDINSLGMSCTRTYQIKERGRTYRRKNKRTIFSDSSLCSIGTTNEGTTPFLPVERVSSGGDRSLDHSKMQVDLSRRKRKKISRSTSTSVRSIEEGASVSVQVVQESSVRDTSLNHLLEAHSCLSHSDEAPESGHSEEMIGEVLAGQDTSLQVAAFISIEKTSSKCADAEPASGEREKDTKTGNFEEIINERDVVRDGSRTDLLERSLEQGNQDKLDAIQKSELDMYSEEETFREPAKLNLVSDSLDAVTKLKDAIPAASQLGVVGDGLSLAVTGKDEPQQTLHSSPQANSPGSSRKKLLVLDVNGLLADIVPYAPNGYEPDTIVSRKRVFKRPFCDDFLQFCFEKFHVGVWSSRTKHNVGSVLDFLMGNSKHRLLFCWDQSHCTNTGFNTVENRDKPMLLKELKKLWEKHVPGLPWERGEYNESNTLLLDDSPYKALRNPPHTAIFPHSFHYKDVKDNSLGPGGNLRIYLEGLALADNVQKYVELNPFGQRPITSKNLSWDFYRKVIGTDVSLKREDANVSSASQ